MASGDILDVRESSGLYFEHSINDRSNFKKNKIFMFFENFASFSSNFGFKMEQIWGQNFWKFEFFKNEALNQKSETVKVLGYA